MQYLDSHLVSLPDYFPLGVSPTRRERCTWKEKAHSIYNSHVPANTSQIGVIQLREGPES